jgi:hypothetical protein
MIMFFVDDNAIHAEQFLGMIFAAIHIAIKNWGCLTVAITLEIEI